MMGKSLKIARSDIEHMDKVFRLNMVNGLSGVKSVHLVGTISVDNVTNLAAISSVVHLSSSPAMLGFMMRPITVPRHTYRNIHETGEFSINLVSSDFTDKAHYTSAKFEDSKSEFEECGLTPEYFEDSKVPSVAESPLKILLKYEEEHFIKASGTILIVGSIQAVYLPQDAVNDAGMIDMELLKAAGLSGLNTYYNVKKEAIYPYARVGQFPQNQIKK